MQEVVLCGMEFRPYEHPFRCFTITAMQPITPEEFKAMEKLMANLLPHCDAQEEVKLLGLHARLDAIYASQSGINASRQRLLIIQSQTPQ